MARFLVQRDGLFLGSSSAVNLVACVKLVRKLGWNNGEKIVTVLCVWDPNPPFVSFSLALTPTDLLARSSSGVTPAPDIILKFVCFSLFEHPFSKLMLWLLTIVLVSHWGCCGASGHWRYLANLWMDPGTTHI
jgi:hypothetical protein